jgi:CheY-like chemotaxis protein
MSESWRGKRRMLMHSACPDQQEGTCLTTSNTSKYRILVVDDEPSVRESLAGFLKTAKYDVSTAENGFDALLQLRRAPSPDVIISDLNMPQMSGFEFLSVVRRRFPDIPVVAVSGAYESGDCVPGGVIADAFYAKGQHHPEELLRTVAELIRTSVARAMNHHRQSAPVWIPRNGKDSKGVPYIVLTCTECLRSFPVSVLREDVQEIQQTPCLFCTTPVRYIIDFSLSVSSPKHDITAGTSGELSRTA